MQSDGSRRRLCRVYGSMNNLWRRNVRFFALWMGARFSGRCDAPSFGWHNAIINRTWRKKRVFSSSATLAQSIFLVRPSDEYSKPNEIRQKVRALIKIQWTLFSSRAKPVFISSFYWQLLDFWFRRELTCREQDKNVRTETYQLLSFQRRNFIPSSSRLSFNERSHFSISNEMRILLQRSSQQSKRRRKRPLRLSVTLTRPNRRNLSSCDQIVLFPHCRYTPTGPTTIWIERNRRNVWRISPPIAETDCSWLMSLRRWLRSKCSI